MLNSTFKSISELFDSCSNEDIYILGTGPSSRVFPLEFLDGKVVIGLNMAWKLYPVKFCITMRPELNIPEFMDGEPARPEIVWITKYEKLINDEQRQFVKKNHERFYFFSAPVIKEQRSSKDPSQSARNTEWIKNRHPDYLYLWTSISQSGMHMAANMGAKNVILIGCDNTDIGGNHHAHNQHTFWKGESPSKRYYQYYFGSTEVREALTERGVNVISLSPFLGLGHIEEDYDRLCDLYAKPKYIKNKDITGTERRKNLLRRIKKLVNILSRVPGRIIGKLKA